MPRWYSKPLNLTHDGILISKLVATFRPKLWVAQAKGSRDELFCFFVNMSHIVERTRQNLPEKLNERHFPHL